MRGAPAAWRSSKIALLCRPDLPVGTAATELGTLNAMGVTGSQDGGGQVVALNHPKARWAWLP